VLLLFWLTPHGGGWFCTHLARRFACGPAGF
jgi:hypothetical protein